MQNKTPAVIASVVENDLCIGCGVCVSSCPVGALNISWNHEGFLTAKSSSNPCDGHGECLKVCPFNPAPLSEYENENKLAALYLTDTPKLHPKIGRYWSLYAGYSRRHRASSSSGGIATYVFEALFERGLIDHAITVGSAASTEHHYEYRIISSKADLISTSKTRYYPVTLASALQKVKTLNGRIAISGVGCFIKAIRLAQAHDPALNEKIVFLTGIICGGLKSSFFTEYLASRAGVDKDDFSNPQYRVKDPKSNASDYSFSCDSPAIGRTHSIKMRTVGDMWGTGMFKHNACDFCDDVTTELADISLGDAWIDPYRQDGKGHNIIVSRTALVDDILKQGRDSGNLALEELAVEDFLLSQEGSFNHRHQGLAFRIDLAKKSGITIPPKRHITGKLSPPLKLVQLARRSTRRRSLEIWLKERTATRFDTRMKMALFRLKLVTKFSRGARKLGRLLRNDK